MTSYELSLLLGSLLMLCGLMALVASMTNRSAIKYAVIFLGLGGGLLYYSHTSNFEGLEMSVSKGLDLGDIPEALYKLVGKILN